MRRLSIVLPTLRVHQDAPGGSTRIAWDEALHLARAGHDVWVVAPDVLGGAPEREERDGIHVLRYELPHHTALDPRRASAHQKATESLLRTHLPGPIDVLHGHAPLQYAGALAAVSPKTRTVYTVHSPAAPEALASAPEAAGLAKLRVRAQAAVLRRVERKLLERTRVVHVLSAYTERLLAEEHALAPARMTRIPGWVDLARFRPVNDREGLKRALGWPEGRVLYTLRRLVPRMGLERLLRAFCEVRKATRDVSLVIAGDGPLRGSLESLASDPELASMRLLTCAAPEEDAEGLT